MTDMKQKYAAQEVPRYTSYPTAVQFNDEVTARTSAKWLAELPEGEALSLYAHIPFCEKMCWYCGCHTNIAPDYSRIDTYVDDLLAEMDLVAKTISPKVGQVKHLHFGGGSPSMLKSPDFARIVSHLKSRFDFAEDAEIAVEIDPRTVDAKKAYAYAQAGVNRASLGVQDFNTHVQKKINRVQPVEMVQNVIGWLHDAGITAINFDLIYGLPGQGETEIAHSLALALTMQPHRFAVFGYAHVPWFKKHQQMIKDEDLPGTMERLAQADQVADNLTRAGYVRVGFDHYARADDNLSIAMREGRIRRNFQGYTDDDCDTLIGFGASSISSLPQGYAQNSPHMGHWRDAVRAGTLPTVRGVALQGEDAFRREAIMQVLGLGHLNLVAHCDRFGMPASAFDEAREKLKPLLADGLAVLDEDDLRVLPEGIRFSRNVAACFDTYWQPKGKRHSVAV